MFAKTVLDNGIRIVTHEIPGNRSISLGIWVENGSRHENAAEHGISHFIEHLLFKGTERRSAAQIAEEMDAVGGVINAFTSKENTCYYVKVLDEDLQLAIDLLSDIFLHSIFDPEEIDFGAMVAAPGPEHWFGTDQYGRDVLSRIIYGSRTALAVGILSSVIGCVLGALLGAASGYFGGRIDSAIQRVVDIMLSFPIIVLAMVVVAVLGKLSVFGIDLNLIAPGAGHA